MITEQQLRPCGPHAILVQLDDLVSVLAVAAALRERQSPDLADVVDVVPAAETVLVTIAGTDLGRLRAALLRLDPTAATTAVDAREIEIGVRYDGPDLAEVAELSGRSVAEVITAHTATPWRAAFGGFAPGFTYLVGGDERLRLARRAAPRTRVPAGSVALGGGYSAVYPRASPGGWHLIGHTDLVVWDTDRDPAALIVPGATVRFTDVGPS